MSNNINIEEIMENIRADIRAKGYPDYEEQNTVSRVSGAPFNKDEFLSELEIANKYCQVASYRDIRSTRKGLGGLITFVKKICRRGSAFYVEPIVDDQNRFNEAVLRMLMQAANKIEEDEKTIAELKRKLEK